MDKWLIGTIILNLYSQTHNLIVYILARQLPWSHTCPSPTTWWNVLGTCLLLPVFVYLNLYWSKTILIFIFYKRHLLILPCFSPKACCFYIYFSIYQLWQVQGVFINKYDYLSVRSSKCNPWDKNSSANNLLEMIPGNIGGKWGRAVNNVNILLNIKPQII